MDKEFDEVVQEWKDLFDKINDELGGDEEDQPVPLTDVEYYAHQIHNLTNEEDYDRALEIAKRMAQLPRDMTISEVSDYFGECFPDDGFCDQD